MFALFSPQEMADGYIAAVAEDIRKASNISGSRISGRDFGSSSAQEVYRSNMAKRGVAAAKNALYLYGVSIATQDETHPLKNPGVDGVHAVTAMPCGEFLCWVSPIDQIAFKRDLEANMENLEWLALHGVRHQQVVAEIAQTETITCTLSPRYPISL